MSTVSFAVDDQRVLIEREDLLKVAEFKWHVIRTRGGMRYVKAHAGTGRNRGDIYLHRMLVGAPSGIHVDHRNGDGLDNTRQNLRLATLSQNAWNNRRRAGRAGHRGVEWHAHSGKWHARYQHEGRRISLGYFNTAEAAHAAWLAVATPMRGEFLRVASTP